MYTGCLGKWILGQEAPCQCYPVTVTVTEPAPEPGLPTPARWAAAKGPLGHPWLWGANMAMTDRTDRWGDTGAWLGQPGTSQTNQTGSSLRGGFCPRGRNEAHTKTPGPCPTLHRCFQKGLRSSFQNLGRHLELQSAASRRFPIMLPRVMLSTSRLGSWDIRHVLGAPRYLAALAYPQSSPDLRTGRSKPSVAQVKKKAKTGYSSEGPGQASGPDLVALSPGLCPLPSPHILAQSAPHLTR